MWSYIKRQLTEQDQFGHVVSLNFNKKGNEHKNVVGGTCSIFLSAFLLWYLINQAILVFTRGNNNITSVISELSLKDLGTVNLESQTLLFYLVVRSTLDFGYTKVTADELEKYVHLEINEWDHDLEQPNPVLKPYIVKNC